MYVSVLLYVSFNAQYSTFYINAERMVTRHKPSSHYLETNSGLSSDPSISHPTRPAAESTVRNIDLDTYQRSTSTLALCRISAVFARPLRSIYSPCTTPNIPFALWSPPPTASTCSGLTVAGLAACSLVFWLLLSYI
ncbi:hypothetical protein BDY19DRAFT_685390 [Irpex rosettiformis]|uniref:Uncharacterized protein n=1 Tax=Irpex rosettiformis TaxID=378272 RepID=A0ACB8UA50_9APHY|nr:hypothetical protein BDY19DRAFT_685390 [Irpex rosettiformis]